MQKTPEKPDWQRKFEQFAAEYPSRLTPRGQMVKLGRHKAEVWFRVHFRRNPDEELFAWIMSSLRQYKSAVDSRCIKDMNRWLNDYRWQDFDAPKTPVVLPAEIQQRAQGLAKQMDVTPKLTPQQEFEQSRQANIQLVSGGPERAEAAMREAADKGNPFAKQWLARHLKRTKAKRKAEPLMFDPDDPDLQGGL